MDENNIFLMIYFQKRLNYKIKKKLMYYREKLESLNILIKKASKFDNKFYNLAI